MKRPKVIIFNEASVDGRLTLSPDTLLWTGDEPEKRWRSIMSETGLLGRIKALHNPTMFLEGSGSFYREKDEPAPLPVFKGDGSILYTDFLPTHIVDREDSRGWFTLVDSRGRMRWLYKTWDNDEWRGIYPLVLVSHATPPEYLSYLQKEDIPYLVAGGEKVNLEKAFIKAQELLSVECVLSTAGGKLNGVLLRYGLVDEVNILFLPALIGGFRTPSLFDSPELGNDEWPVRLNLIHSETFDKGEVWLRYEVIR
jgi:2,5-diamino-6-(ribosylamino)-4(3H)-pyrimidinone 5'-phosphate reductase